MFVLFFEEVVYILGKSRTGLSIVELFIKNVQGGEGGILHDLTYGAIHNCPYLGREGGGQKQTLADREDLNTNLSPKQAY